MPLTSDNVSQVTVATKDDDATISVGESPTYLWLTN
jgi:hypothetical protein